MRLVEWFPPKYEPTEPMRFIEFLNISVQEEEGKDPECKITLVHLDWNSLDSKINEKSEENLEEKETKKRKRKQTIAARALHSKNSDSGGITSINYLIWNLTY